MKLLIVDDERIARSEIKFLLKEENPNTHGIPAEEYDQEHFSWQSMVLASSEKVDF